MNDNAGSSATGGPSRRTWPLLISTLRRGYTEFLAVPTWVIVGFLLLAVLSTVLDHSELPLVAAGRGRLQHLLFGNAKSTSSLLGTIAAGLFTVTSITVSLVLLAVQQAASGLTFQVIDQFLRRRVNQLTFGFFVGLALYSLLILTSVDQDAGYNPVYGAFFSFLLSIVALYLLLLLLYATINQMRPSVIIRAIQDHTLSARTTQIRLVQRTRRTPQLPRRVARVRAIDDGYVGDIDLDRITRALGSASESAQFEVVLTRSIGSYAAYGDELAEIRGTAPPTDGLCDAIRRAIHLSPQRDVDGDPAYGVEQMLNIAWTSISTSKQNPEPGLLVTRALKDLLARWVAAEENEGKAHAREAVPVVYTDDVLARLLDAFGSLVVVASESLQHQSAAEALQALAGTYERLPRELQRRVDDLWLRALSSLGEHVLTLELEQALDHVVSVLEEERRPEVASCVRTAREQLASTIGRLNARSTRPTAGRK